MTSTADDLEARYFRFMHTKDWDAWRGVFTDAHGAVGQCTTGSVIGSPPPVETLHGAGHYHETYAKVDGEWKIQSLHLTRTRMHFIAP